MNELKLNHFNNLFKINKRTQSKMQKMFSSH